MNKALEGIPYEVGRQIYWLDRIENKLDLISFLLIVIVLILIFYGPTSTMRNENED